MPGFTKDSNGVWIFDGVLVGDAAQALDANSQSLSSLIGSVNTNKTDSDQFSLAANRLNWKSKLKKFDPEFNTISTYHFDDLPGSTSAIEASQNTPMILGGGAVIAAGDGGNVGNSNPVKTFASGGKLQTGATGYGTVDGLIDTVPSELSVSFWWKGTATLGNRWWNKSCNGNVDFLDFYVYQVTGVPILRVGSGGNVVLVFGLNVEWNSALWYNLVVTLSFLNQRARIYLNACLEGESPLAAVPNPGGSPLPFIFGAYNQGGSPSNFLGGLYDELIIENREWSPTDVKQVFNRREFTGLQTVQDRLARASNIITPTLTTEGQACFEPALKVGTFVDGVTQGIKVWYTGGTNSAPESSIHYAEAIGSDPLHLTTTKFGRVLGQGEGNWAGIACRTSLGNFDNAPSQYSTGYYIYFVDGYGIGAKWRVSYSDDGKTFDSAPVLLASPGDSGLPTNVAGFANSEIWYDAVNHLFKATVDYYNSDDAAWHELRFTGSTPLNMTYSHTLPGLDFTAGSTSCPGRGVLKSGVSANFCHCSINGVLPSYLYLAFSVDDETYTLYPHNPIGGPVPGSGNDQGDTDPCDPIYYQSYTIIGVDHDNNTVVPLTAGIDFLFFLGTLDDLVTDSPTVPNEIDRLVQGIYT